MFNRTHGCSSQFRMQTVACSSENSCSCTRGFVSIQIRLSEKRLASQTWGVVYYFCPAGDQSRVIALATAKDLKKKE